MSLESKNRISRRIFAKGALTAALGVAPPPATPSSPQQQPAAPELPPAQMHELEARFNEVIRRYGDRLNDEQRQRVRRVLAQNERMLAALREFPLENGDPPAPVLKISFDKPISNAR